jgi:hypothetical protein
LILLLQLLDFQPVLVVLLLAEPLINLVAVPILDHPLKLLLFINLSLKRSLSIFSHSCPSISLNFLLRLLLPSELLIPIRDELTELEIAMHGRTHNLFLVLALPLPHDLIFMNKLALVRSDIRQLFLCVLMHVGDILAHYVLAYPGLLIVLLLLER